LVVSTGQYIISRFIMVGKSAPHCAFASLFHNPCRLDGKLPSRDEEISMIPAELEEEGFQSRIGRAFVEGDEALIGRQLLIVALDRGRDSRD
jgi:hypothetical protein